jgi:hypothetical protein
MSGKIKIFLGKKFWKIISATNSTEFSAENHFPRNKMYEKSLCPKLQSWEMMLAMPSNSSSIATCL